MYSSNEYRGTAPKAAAAALLRPAAVAALAMLLFAGCGDDPSGPVDGDGEIIPAGGTLTISDATGAAYSQPAPILAGEDMDLHAEGDAAFEATFVTAPAPRNSGLGPVFNNSSCISCHTGDGRGRLMPPGSTAGDVTGSALFRISMPGASPTEAPRPVPGFGGQLQDRSVHAVPAEARVQVTYTDRVERMSDGTQVLLRAPNYRITGAYISFPSEAQLSPRVAPPVFGTGLLEAVSDAAIMANADEDDRNGDGISGRPNRVMDVRTGRIVIGRFGWKAGAPDLLQQTVGAYNEDMGITSTLLKTESCHGQPQDKATQPAGPEVNDDDVRAVVHYMRTLAVPGRRSTDDARVRRGEKLFAEARCSGCHRPSLTTGSSELALLADQRIAPYTDLLLHDMGPDLADNRPDYAATGSEWRTPALWGIGLTRIVSGHTEFLHDGRARSLLEAIMWHGGEAEFSRERVRAMSAEDRSALLMFLESL